MRLHNASNSLKNGQLELAQPMHGVFVVFLYTQCIATLFQTSKREKTYIDFMARSSNDGVHGAIQVGIESGVPHVHGDIAQDGEDVGLDGWVDGGVLKRCGA